MPTIAIIGASSDRAKFGNRSVRAYAKQGWTVYPVNPKEAEIEGLPCYAAIADVPSGRLDRVTLYLGPALGIKAIDEIAKRGEIGEVMLNPGADDPAVVARGRELGLNVVVGCSLIALGL
jgi:hypothetical protein